MFVSFFPRPKLFFLSVILWSAVAAAIWYGLGDLIGSAFGIAPEAADADPVIGLAYFVTPQFLLFYGYYAICTVLFAAFWFAFSPHRWQWWSIVGSALILFSTYYSVQVSVAINNWRRPFFDAVQNALSKESTTTAGELYGFVFDFAAIAFVYIIVYVLTRFFVSHWIFRWRTAMNDYYVAGWSRLRSIEGAAQRVQEDTMRFASTMEGLGKSLIDSVMTLIAFLPVLLRLSENVTDIPIIGQIPYALVIVALGWSLLGTGLLALIGIRLPGLEFKNQRVEAAFRKELVYGEDFADRADPPTLGELFNAVRRNYFTLYFNYMYFNVGRIIYLQTDNIFPYIILAPTIVAGKITLGAMNQILNAFDQVKGSMQYLVNSWSTIVELISIYKRLRLFESAIGGEASAEIAADEAYGTPAA